MTRVWLESRAGSWRPLAAVVPLGATGKGSSPEASAEPRPVPLLVSPERLGGEGSHLPLGPRPVRRVPPWSHPTLS